MQGGIKRFSFFLARGELGSHTVAVALIAPPPRPASAVEQAGAAAGNREPLDLVEHHPIFLPAPCARRWRRNRAHDLRQSKQGQQIS